VVICLSLKEINKWSRKMAYSVAAQQIARLSCYLLMETNFIFLSVPVSNHNADVFQLTGVERIEIA
jgi:hypothetical protein